MTIIKLICNARDKDLVSLKNILDKEENHIDLNTDFTLKGRFFCEVGNFGHSTSVLFVLLHTFNKTYEVSVDFFQNAIDLFIKDEANINEIDSLHQTILHKTCQFVDDVYLKNMPTMYDDFCKVLKIILKYNPDTTIIDINNKTAEDYVSIPEIKALFQVDCPYVKIYLD